MPRTATTTTCSGESSRKVATISPEGCCITCSADAPRVDRVRRFAGRVVLPEDRLDVFFLAERSVRGGAGLVSAVFAVDRFLTVDFFLAMGSGREGGSGREERADRAGTGHVQSRMRKRRAKQPSAIWRTGPS